MGCEGQPRRRLAHPPVRLLPDKRRRRLPAARRRGDGGQLHRRPAPRRRSRPGKRPRPARRGGPDQLRGDAGRRGRGLRHGRHRTGGDRGRGGARLLLDSRADPHRGPRVLRAWARVPGGRRRPDSSRRGQTGQHLRRAEVQGAPGGGHRLGAADRDLGAAAAAGGKRQAGNGGLRFGAAHNLGGTGGTCTYTILERR